MLIESVPVAIMSLYFQDTFVIEILFVNRIPFLISISLHLKFGTVERIENHCVPTLVKAVRKIKKNYGLRVFNLAVIKMNPDF